MSKKIILLAVFCFSVFITYSQSWQKSIDKINEYTRVYDPYYRTFSFNPTTNYITFITSDKDITIKFDIKKVNFVKEVNGDKYYLTFKCKDDSKCIVSDYSGDINATAITITNGNVVDELIIELNKIVSQAKTISTSTTTSSYQSKIEQINEYTKLYDPYKRIFSYNASKNEITWVTSDGDITCVAKLSNIKVYVESLSSGSQMVTFATLDNSKTIECNYGGPTNKTAITMSNKEYAEKVVTIILSLNSSSTANATISGLPTSKKIEQINEICKKFDPYTRTFSYNEATGILKWVSNGNIISSAKLKNIRLEVKANSSDFSLRFVCIDESNCVECTYGGPTSVSSITLSTRESAEEIKSLIEGIQGKSNSSPTPPASTGSRLTNKISNTK